MRGEAFRSNSRKQKNSSSKRSRDGRFTARNFACDAPDGERSFRYWRETSAARTLFSGVGARLSDLAEFDVIYLSGITLAILPPDVRAALIGMVRGLKDEGKQVVFDSNHRPRLWPCGDGAGQF